MLNLSQFGLTYPQILSLIDLGLLHQSEIESGEMGKNQQFAMVLPSATVARPHQTSGRGVAVL